VQHQGKASIAATTEDGPARLGTTRPLAAVLAIAAAILLVGPVSGALAAGAPLVLRTYSERVETNQANLKAQIDSNEAATTYFFEYTSEASYEQNEFAGASRVPATGEIPLAIKSQNAAQHVDGLDSASAYRFRVVAKNEFGPTLGPTRLLTTDEHAPKFSLPDTRGWELVSPTEKNGGQVDDPESDYGGGAFQAAAQGGGVTYSSLDSFAGGLGSPGASQYLSLRGEGGWTTQNLTVPQYSGGYDTSPGAGTPDRLFSDDLGAGLLTNGRRCRGEGSACPVANPPLPGSGAPAGYRNFYLRDTGTGAFQALLKSADVAGLKLGPDKFEVSFVAATPDLDQVVLSTCAALTGDAIEVAGTEGECDPAKANLYLFSAAGLKLINILPGDSQGSPGASIGASTGAVSGDGSRVYFARSGNLYLREGAQSVQVDQSLGGGGAFQTAATDGSVSYFSKGGHLYRYLAAAKAATDVTPGGGLQGVLGATPDGASVYYQTAAGVFLYHAGATTPVSPPADASNYPPATGTARVSGDGQVLVFLSSTDLTEYNSNGKSEVFRFSTATGLSCVSCDPSGELPTGSARIPGAVANGLAFRAYKPRVLSTGGGRVFFETDDALVTLDSNLHGDVYQWEADGVGSCGEPAGCLNLISSGDEASATFVDASADGSDVFFNTDGSLVPSDPGSIDIYDARVGGGLPVPEPPIACSGDSCQALPPEPEDPKPGTILEGLGNEPLRAAPKTKKRKKHHHHAKANKRNHRGHAKRGGSK
jgi:hypothetical protein